MFSIDPVLELLSRSLDACTLRQGVYAANIANADTVGYRPLEVSFEESLRSAAQLSQSAPSAQQMDVLRQIEPSIVPAAADTVQLDQQLALMDKNAIRYQMLVGGFERSISLLRMAVLEGREG
ncbi:MAG TPA: flagellar basal body protein [Steroidobacteraceae bacterium]|jgi:flagellar basal-body rod protein FlgB|nr:flagellar basal body protein [Steroidobacteraceae bacterium]